MQHALHLHGAYSLDHKIEQVLSGLGFVARELQQPVEQLSGGQQNRLLLARMLLAEPDVMLLDEPSNHLDIEATEWLEDFLRDTDQAMIIVSHDRYFLDRVTDRTLELFDGTVESYSRQLLALLAAEGRAARGPTAHLRKATRSKSPKPRSSSAATSPGKRPRRPRTARKSWPASSASNAPARSSAP